MLPQWHLPSPLTRRVKLPLFTHVYYNPVSLAARFMDVTQTILIILTMVGVFWKRLWLWATGDWQLHHDNTPGQASYLVQSILVKHQITQVTHPRYNSDLVPCNFWLFPKLKLPLKGKRFHTINEIQENMMGQLMVIGRTVWGPKVPALKGTEASLPYIQCILYLLQYMSLFFIFHGWMHSGEKIYILFNIYIFIYL